MGIFSFFSNLIKKKAISLPEKYKGDIVYFVPLKNNSIELGTKVQIEHGYNLVVAYHNKVLDILRDDEGEVKLEDITVPRLFREHHHMLAKKGIVTPKTLPADIYFVKLDGHNLSFKTHEKFLCKTPNGKMKIRLLGNFDFCIKDMRKFMGVFCSEFAVVRNKTLGREISILVADEVSKILDKAELSFDIYTTCKEKVQDLILSKLSKLCVSLGIDITAIRIDDLIIPKKEKKLHDLVLKRGQEDEFLTHVEQELNSAQKPQEKVFVTASNNEIILGKEEANMGSALSNGSSFSNAVQGESSVNFNSQNDSNLFLGGDNKNNFGSDNSTYNNFNSNNAGKVLENENWNGFEQTSQQKEPNLFENDDESVQAIENYMAKHGKSDKETEIGDNKKNSLTNDNKVDNSTMKCPRCGENIDGNSNFCKKCGSQIGGLVVCPCCGAKNSAGSESCMVCKSKL